MFFSLRRLFQQDLMLIAICVATITMHLWPSTTPRQMIHCRDVHGNTTLYSLSLNDSRLSQIRRSLERQTTPGPSPALVVTKWRSEIAAHYADRCQAACEKIKLQAAIDAERVASYSGPSDSGIRMPGVVQMASFEKSKPVPVPPVNELMFWRNMKQKSDASAAAIEQQLAKEATEKSVGPFALGDVFTPAKGLRAWFVSMLLAMLAVCIYAEWQCRAPAIELTESTASAPSDNVLGLANRTVRFEVPREWIRIHQPTSVVIRQASLVAWVALAALVQLT